MPFSIRRKTYSPFVRRQRAAARKALYGSLVLMALAAYGGRAFLRRPLLGDQAWMQVDWAANPDVDLLRRYIRIDTTQQTGDEVAAVRFLADELARSGIAATIEELPGKRANLWAFIEGSDPRAIVLHQHVDTDPVPNPEHWQHPPWSADIEGPWLFGRGAFDMKAVGIAQLVAARRLVASGRPLQRSVLVLATSSEEHGSDYGLRWLMASHPELISRFGVFLTEGGAVEARSPEDIKYWGTETAQRRYVIVLACAESRERLEELRGDLALVVPRPQMTEALRHFLAAYGSHRDAPRIRGLLARPTRLLRDPAALGELPHYLQNMFVHSVYPQAVVEAPGGGYQMEIRLLLLPGAEFEAARAELLPDWLFGGVRWVVREPSGSDAGSPPDDPTFRVIQELLSDRFPGAPTGPWLPDGSITDARFVRPLGIPAFGFTPFLALSTDTLKIGRANERVDLPGFVNGVELYSELLRRLALDDNRPPLGDK